MFPNTKGSHDSSLRHLYATALEIAIQVQDFTVLVQGTKLTCVYCTTVKSLQDGGDFSDQLLVAAPTQRNPACVCAGGTPHT
jgi:hypothetical protein